MSQEEVQKRDPIATLLSNYAQTILVVVFGLLPLVFIPSAVAPFEYTKVFFVAIGLCAAIVLHSLSVLRSGMAQFRFSSTLYALWAVVGVVLVSALLSGDIRDALVGDFFSAQSATFVAILALVPTTWLMLSPNKRSVMYLYTLLALSTLVLILYYVLRVFIGPEFLSFGIFTSATASLVGTWNDLALFLGLGVILSLVVLEHMTLTPLGRRLFILATVCSLFMLAVINFFAVWFVLGLSSLVLIVYIFGRDRFSATQPLFAKGNSVQSLSARVTIGVFLISLLFIVAGSFFGGYITKITGVNYIEVRPSFEATLNVARQVYADNALLGTGPNKFIDAWRLYKDNAINTTAFWNTDFSAGSGYITTFFVTSGVLGGLAWIAFLLMYVIGGVRALLRVSEADKMWYFIAVSSFVASVYVWGMSLLFVPGVVVLLIGALCTGIALQAFSMLGNGSVQTFALGDDRRTGFLLTVGVIVIIVVAVSALYATTRHYSSVYAFNSSILSMQEGKQIAELEQEVLSAYALSASDVFARRIAEYQLARLNSLMQVESPTEEQVQEFNDASINGVRFAQEATRIDALEPVNWAVLAAIYDVLASVNAEGAADEARKALERSRALNPKNPLPQLESAILEARAGDFALARTYVDAALALKPNFSEAYYLLSQLAIAQGNVDEAVQSTRAVIALEPKNPVRHYQLGVLESSRKDTDAAIRAFEDAIALDADYANARYLLAFAYDLKGDSARAREQLETVRALNPDNAEVDRLLGALAAGQSLASMQASVAGTVDEPMPTTSDTGSVESPDSPTTPLVTPLNTAPTDGN